MNSRIKKIVSSRFSCGLSRFRAVEVNDTVFCGLRRGRACAVVNEKSFFVVKEIPRFPVRYWIEQISAPTLLTVSDLERIQVSVVHALWQIASVKVCPREFLQNYCKRKTLKEIKVQQQACSDNLHPISGAAFFLLS